MALLGVIRRCCVAALTGAILVQELKAQDTPKLYFQPLLGFQNARIVDRQFPGPSDSNESTGLAVGFGVGYQLLGHLGVDLAARTTSDFDSLRRFTTHTWGIGLVVTSHRRSGLHARIGLSHAIANVSIDCAGFCGPTHSNRPALGLSAGGTFRLNQNASLGPTIWYDRSFGGRFSSRAIGAALMLRIR